MNFSGVSICLERKWSHLSRGAPRRSATIVALRWWPFGAVRVKTRYAVRSAVGIPSRASSTASPGETPRSSAERVSSRRVAVQSDGSG